MPSHYKIFFCLSGVKVSHQVILQKHELCAVQIGLEDQFLNKVVG